MRRPKLFYFVLIDILVCRLNSYLSISTFFSSPGKKKREINHHLVPFFDIPISIEAPTRAIYIYTYKYTHTFSLICLFFLSLTHSLVSLLICSYLYYKQRLTAVCLSKLNLSRLIEISPVIYVCMLTDPTSDD